MHIVTVEREIGGQILKIETGKLAKQAHGAVVVQYGGTIVLTAAVEGAPRGTDFFPLTVDYRERTYAAGKFPGGFKKREGAPTTKEILTSRLADRPIRPLFPENYINEVQVMSTVLSADRQNDPDILSIIGSSAALFISHIPFQGPIAAMRLGKVKGELLTLPTAAQLEESDLDLIVAGHRGAVCMIEGFARELPEDEMAEAILEAHRQLLPIIDMQIELREKLGLPPRPEPAPVENQLLNTLRDRYYDSVKWAKKTEGKQARKDAVKEVEKRAVAEVANPDAGGS
ncbi:MAG: polyribonucleotide nucleotidyltransferase, partial [Planctomycetia bacterium]